MTSQHPGPGPYQQQPAGQPAQFQAQQAPAVHPGQPPSYQQPTYPQQAYLQPVGTQPPMVQVGAPQGAMAPPAQQPPWATKPKRRIVAEVLLVVLGGLLASAFIALTALVTSGSATAVAVVLALVPLVIVGAVVLWVDRWEPEPRLLLVGAFLWGGGVAVAIASFLNSVVGPAVADALGTGMEPGTASAVFGAPIVEEAAKGLGILLIFLVRRREFNGPVDGVVYASVVALGFAVVEDVQYFALNSEDVGIVFVMRALLSPFGHLIYSVPMGIALGIASRRRSRTAWVWMFPIGYLIGVALHMAWNGSLSYFVSSNAELVGVFVLLNWVPLALFAGVVIWLRRRESAVIGARLRDYVPTGWLTEAEVQVLSSMSASRTARSWAAAQLGPGGKQAMRTYQRAAVELAYARQDLYTGHLGNRARQDEATLLDAMARARADVMARSAARAGA